VRPVNLIPKEQQRRTGGVTAGRTGIAPYLLLGFLGLAVLGVAAVVTTSNSVKSKEQKVADLESQTTTAKAAADQLRPYGNFAQVKQARVDTVNSLVDTTFNWERVVRSLSRTIPSNVWLTTFTGTVSPEVKLESEGAGAAASARAKTKAPAIALSGCTYSHTAVARMMVRMRNLDDVSDVLLQTSEKPDNAAQASSASDEGGGSDDCRTKPSIPKFEILVVLGYDKTQAAAASAAAGAVTASAGSNPVAAAQGAAATASSTTSGESTP
jgi:Tfp pilus assembly protein PilN